MLGDHLHEVAIADQATGSVVVLVPFLGRSRAFWPHHRGQVWRLDKRAQSPSREYDFEFNKADLLDFWSTHKSSPLIEVQSSNVDLAMGFLYSLISDVAGTAGGDLATLLTEIGALECGNQMGSAAFTDQSAPSIFSVLVSCLMGSKDKIVQHVIQVMAQLHPDKNLAQITEEVSGRHSPITSLWWLVVLVQGEQIAGDAAADAGFGKTALQFIFQPTVNAMRGNVRRQHCG